MEGAGGRLTRPSESYGTLGWVGHSAWRNIKWARAVGMGPVLEEHELDPLLRLRTAARRAVWRRRHPCGEGRAVAVFVVGAPRSGTNMVVRGLAASPEFSVRNEGDRRAFYRYRLRSDETIRTLILESRQRFVLIKPLLDSHRVLGLLDGLALPVPPRALWLYRDADGRSRSALKKFGPAANNALRDISLGVGATLWQAQGLSDDSLQLIRRFDWTTAEPAEGTAMMWYVRNRLYFELGLDQRDDVLPVSYGSLTGQPAQTMKSVCRFLGATWDPSMVADFDGRSSAARPPLPVHPEIRRRCDELFDQLNRRSAAALARLGDHDPVAGADVRSGM